jgi:hypothetical protein
MSFPTSSEINNGDRSSNPHDREQKQVAKHTLLASAANQNYQRCYRALKSLEKYWAGVKYILTVLDQKAKGVGDPLLYTREEMESALEAPRPEPSFTSPGWRRKLSWGTYLSAQNMDVDAAKVSAVIRKGAKTPIPGSPMNPNQGQFVASNEQAKANISAAIGWSLTGTMNSPSTNVAVMYTSENNSARDTRLLQPKPAPSTNSQSSAPPALSNPTIKFETPQALPTPGSIPSFDPAAMPPPPINTVPTPDPVLVSDADLLLNLHSPFSAASQPTSFARSSASALGPGQQQPAPPQPDFSSPTYSTYPTPSDHAFSDMVIDSQEVDMSLLGPEMMPWDLSLEYLPHDMLYFGDGGFGLDESGTGDSGG